MSGADLAVAERATALAEKYGEAILRLQAILTDDELTDSGKVMRARVVIASLAPATNEEHSP